MQKICLDCGTAYAYTLDACPRCGGTESVPDWLAEEQGGIDAVMDAAREAAPRDSADEDAGEGEPEAPGSPPLPAATRSRASTPPASLPASSAPGEGDGDGTGT